MEYKLKMATSEAGKSTRRKKERVWTETELKYLALVLADEKTQYAVILETLTLTKSANNLVKIGKVTIWLVPMPFRHA